MDSENISKHIQEILYGKTIKFIKDGANVENQYFLRSLTGKESALVSNLHEIALKEGRKANLCTQEEFEALFKKSNVWTEEDDNRIESLKVGIARLSSMMEDFKFLKSKWHSIKKERQKAQKELEELQNNKQRLFANCLEYRAQEVKFRWIAFYSLETIDEKSFWTIDEFNNFIDFIFINNVITAYIDSFVLPTKTVREIARSPLWRYKWCGTKNAADIFGKPASEWSEAQNSLIYWSLYYDNIFENPDVPHEIIDDDDALDVWLTNKYNERKKDVLSNKKTDGKSGLQEVFIFTDKNDKKTQAEIASMNNPATRARLRKERKLIEDKGEVSEWNLRGKQN